MKYMDVKEFFDEGYLLEINRRLLHPLGLALEVIVEDDGTHRLGRIWDFRDDPEGLYFNAEVIDPEKSQHISDLEDARREERTTRLGYWIQPPS